MIRAERSTENRHRTASLLAMLAHSDNQVIINALNELESLGPIHDRALQEIAIVCFRLLLSGNNPDIRHRAFSTLDVISRTFEPDLGRQVIELFLANLDVNDGHTRAMATEALGKLSSLRTARPNPEAVEDGWRKRVGDTLISLLDDQDENVRLSAVRALERASLADPALLGRALEALNALLERSRTRLPQGPVAAPHLLTTTAGAHGDNGNAHNHDREEVERPEQTAGFWVENSTTEQDPSLGPRR